MGDSTSVPHLPLHDIFAGVVMRGGGGIQVPVLVAWNVSSYTCHHLQVGQGRFEIARLHAWEPSATSGC